MLRHIIKQQLPWLIITGARTPRLIPTFFLSAWLSVGAAEGQAALFPDIDLGRWGQDMVAHILSSAANAVASSEKSVAPEVPPQQAAESVNAKTRKIARSTIRGMKQSEAAEEERVGYLPELAKVLDAQDEKNYREIFAQLKAGDLKEAQASVAAIKDDVLLGTVEAAFLLHPRNPHVKAARLIEWLTHYRDLPQAQDIYKKAYALRVADDAELIKPLRGKVTDNVIQRPIMAETVEWKKPRQFSAQALWRAGRFKQAIDAIGDVELAEHAPFEAYYPLWIKGLSAYAVEDYILAANSFAQIARGSVPPVNQAAAAFWAARSYEKTSQSEQAPLFYEQAAQNPHSYYGMLALAQKTSRDNSMLDIWHEPAFSKRHVAAIRQHKAGARALALLQIGEKDLALRELQAIRDQPELQDALAALSDAVGLSLTLPSDSGHINRFPVLAWQPVGGFISDPALVMAIAWNESRFETHAQSPSGARGIMQIMPDTAEHIMAGSSGTLFNPVANVTLGDQYIARLAGMNGIDGNLLLIIAGYNCGPGKVQELYADARHGKDPLLFIETMPLKETRDYVQRVISTYASYRLRLGKPLGAVAALSQGQWPLYEMTRTAAK